jgi:hypothetical protein
MLLFRLLLKESFYSFIKFIRETDLCFCLLRVVNGDGPFRISIINHFC